MVYIGSRLEPGDVGPFALAMAESLGREPDPSTRGHLANMLSELLEYVAPADLTPVARVLTEAMMRESAVIKDPSPGAFELSASSVSIRYLIASALRRAVERLGESEIGPIARELTRAMALEQEKSCFLEILGTLGDIGDRLAPTDALPAAWTWLDRVRQGTLSEALTSDERLHWWVTGQRVGGEEGVPVTSPLASFTARLAPDEALAVARSFLELTNNVTHPDDFKLPYLRSDEFLKIAGRLAPDEAEKLCDSLARSAAERIETRARTGFVRNARPLDEEAANLARLSAYLRPGDAERICEPVARTLVDAIRKRDLSEQDSVRILALGQVMPLLNHVEKARICREANQILFESEIGYRWKPSVQVMYFHVVGLHVINGAGPGYARALARGRVTWICSHVGDLVPYWTERQDLTIDSRNSLVRNLLTDSRPEYRARRATRFAATTFCLGPGASLAALTREVTEPYPCRLTDQELVELLKMPTCFGFTRRVVLDQLGNIHGRRFFNHWEFVRFAKEKGLKLDFTSPPRRPDPKASLQRLLDESYSSR